MFEDFDTNWDSPLGIAFRNLDNAVKKLFFDTDEHSMRYSPITSTINAYMFGDIPPEVTFTNILRILVNHDIIQYKNQFKHTYKSNGEEYKHITTLLNKCKKLINLT